MEGIDRSTFSNDPVVEKSQLHFPAETAATTTTTSAEVIKAALSLPYVSHELTVSKSTRVYNFRYVEFNQLHQHRRISRRAETNTAASKPEHVIYRGIMGRLSPNALRFVRKYTSTLKGE